MDNILFPILSLIIGILVGSIAVWVAFNIKASKAIKNANKFIEDAKKEAEKKGKMSHCQELTSVLSQIYPQIKMQTAGKKCSQSERSLPAVN
mgnify:CR=1 FL=1